MVKRIRKQRHTFYVLAPEQPTLGTLHTLAQAGVR